LVSKPRLTLNNGVAALFKMLTYCKICCAFSSGGALLLNVIQGFETNLRKLAETPSSAGGGVLDVA
jgi:hypothetical protein